MTTKPRQSNPHSRYPSSSLLTNPGSAIDLAWARTFIRDVLAEHPLGLLALDALDALDAASPEAGRRLLTLARAVIREGGGA